MVSDRIHGTYAREGLDKTVLFLAFATGAVGTIWLKMVEVPVLLVVFFPVVVLVLYVAACLMFRSIGTEPETIGDNSYYLGFLFTLASLAVTLYRIKDIGAEDADLIPMVISGFGVALSSTIAGVFLRVFLLQLRPDIVARDRAARRDLATGARDLRGAMMHASRVLKDVAVETQQHVAERNHKMSEILAVQAEETSARLERQSEAYDHVIREFGRKLTEVAGALREQAAASAKELQVATETFRAGLEALAASRNTAEGDLRSSLEGFRDVVDEIRTATAEHGKATEGSYRTLAARSTKISEVLVAASDTVEQAVAESRRVVEESRASSEQAVAEAGRVVEESRAARDQAVAEARRVVEESRAASDQAVAEAHRVVEESRAAGNASRDSAKRQERVLQEQAEGVTRAMRHLETTLSDRADAVARMPLVTPAPAAVEPSSAAPPAPANADGGVQVEQVAPAAARPTLLRRFRG